MGNVELQSLEIWFPGSRTPDSYRVPLLTSRLRNVMLLEQERRKSQLAIIVQPFREYSLLLLLG